MDKAESKEMVLRGIGGAPGICIGKAYLVDREGVDLIKRYAIVERDIPAEVNRFKNAVKKAKDDLKAVVESLGEDFSSQVDILETHLVLFKDKLLYGKTIDSITQEKINAEWALKKVTRQVKNMFQRMEDEYLKSRVADISQVSEQIMRQLMGAQDIKISDIRMRVILVAHDLSPAETSQIQLEHIKGFVTDRGGRDTHTSIIAKSLNIPAVTGLGTATVNVQNDDILIVDGSTGQLIINPEEDTLFRYEERRAQYEQYRALITRESHLPSVTLDGYAMKLMANIELVEEVVSVRDNVAHGIGLFRTEFIYIDQKRFPTEEELFDRYREAVELMTPQPVTIRTLDINGDKVLPYFKNIGEENPALGLRAVRFSLHRPEIFLTQIRAILRAAAFGNIRLLIPMITCVEEIIEVRKLLDRAIMDLTHEEMVFNKDIPLGIMIEVPSAAIMADELAKHVDFFSIGTNDLIQYSLAIDRNNRQVAHLYRPLNPAVLRLIKMVVDAAHRQNIIVTICGEMAGDPVNVPVLMGLGFTELSMNPGSIPVIKQVIRKLNYQDAVKMTETVLTMDNTEEIYRFVQATYTDILQ
ncbi:MAG: phosphoenolpyruvate--protein phosphotransferase [Desulfobacterium sp.]